MKIIISLYGRMPPQYRMPVLAGLAGVLLLLIFTGWSVLWALKAAFSLGFKLLIVIAVCAVIFKIQQEFKKRKAGGR